MDSLPRLRPQPRPWYQSLLALGLIALLLSSFATIAAHPRGEHIDRQLLDLATRQPATLVSVVVQKLTHERGLEERIADLGGTITSELPIINGFTARLTAGALPALAAETNVRWISLDTPLVDHACTGTGCIDPAKLATVYNQTIGSTQLWNRTPQLRGSRIGVAVLDSGMTQQQDLNTVNGVSRIVAAVAYNNGWNQSTNDMFGHGNHIIGLIGGNGSRSAGRYVGVAPNVNIVSVKISDDLNLGTATTTSMLDGMQWIYDNKDAYNIRVVNISLTDSVIESYQVSPLSAAAERLWQRGIVVVVAAGNGGKDSLAAPGNDPFVITVGAADDRGTSSPSDDTIPTWSSYGTTVDGFAKPDLVAPGVSLIAPLPVPNSYLAQTYPGNLIQGSSGDQYFRMSGTSVAAPLVAGSVALLLQSEPGLTPDQVKYRLVKTARAMPSATGSGAGLLNIASAVLSPSLVGSANAGVTPSAAIGNLTSDVGSTAKWSTAKWSTAKWSTAKWSTMKP